MQTLLLILSLVPSLINIIKAIEEAIPGKGQGEMKLAAVREIIEQVYSPTILPDVTKVVNILVNLFNKTKTFSK